MKYPNFDIIRYPNHNFEKLFGIQIYPSLIHTPRMIPLMPPEIAVHPKQKSEEYDEASNFDSSRIPIIPPRTPLKMVILILLFFMAVFQHARQHPSATGSGRSGSRLGPCAMTAMNPLGQLVCRKSSTSIGSTISTLLENSLPENTEKSFAGNQSN